MLFFMDVPFPIFSTLAALFPRHANLISPLPLSLSRLSSLFSLLSSLFSLLSLVSLLDYVTDARTFLEEEEEEEEEMIMM